MEPEEISQGEAGDSGISSGENDCIDSGSLFYGTLPWRDLDLEQFISIGIEFNRENILIKYLKKREWENIRIYVKELLKRNRIYSKNNVGVEFFDRKHKTWQEIKGVINTLLLLGYGFHGKGINANHIKEWRNRWGEGKYKKKKIIDLDLWLLEIMNEVLKPEEIELSEYGREKERIRLEAQFYKYKEFKKKREEFLKKKRIEKRKEKRIEMREKKKKAEKEKKEIKRNKPFKKAQKISVPNPFLVHSATGDAKQYVKEFLKQKGK